MDKKTYNRITRFCLVSGVGAALLYEPDSELQWIALGIAVLAAVVASSLYFYCHLRRPSEAASSHRTVALDQPAVLRHRHPDGDLSASASLQITDHQQAPELLWRPTLLSQYEAELGTVTSWLKDSENSNKALSQGYWLAVYRLYLDEGDSYTKCSKSKVNNLPSALVQASVESYLRTSVIAKSKHTHRKPRSSERAHWTNRSIDETEAALRV